VKKIIVKKNLGIARKFCETGRAARLLAGGVAAAVGCCGKHGGTKLSAVVLKNPLLTIGVHR